jgi:hypothetical protein
LGLLGFGLLSYISVLLGCSELADHIHDSINILAFVPWLWVIYEPIGGVLVSLADLEHQKIRLSVDAAKRA